MRRLSLQFLIGVLLLVLPALCTAASGSPREDDEKRLWAAAEEVQKSIDESGLVCHIPDLQTYLQALVAKVAPPEALSTLPISISIIRTPYLNAIAFPNGRIYINEGMLAQVENEAQFATILGHEMTHVFRRHALQDMRNTKSKTAFFAVLNSVTGNVLAPLTGLGAVGLVQGYSRDLEREADVEGLRLMVAAGYDPAEAPKAFTILQQEARAEKISESAFFSNHPRLQERVEDYQELLKTTYASHKGGTSNGEGYRRMIAPLYLDNATLDLKRGSFDVARRTIERFIQVKGEDARALFLLGESWRQEGGAEAAAKATTSYRKAAALDPAYAEPHRALGVSAYKKKEWEAAKQSLERYLALAPQAPDRGYIEQMLKNLAPVTSK